ncbi:hypothetical protein GN956_G2536 [Arapaima gigas]
MTLFVFSGPGELLLFPSSTWSYPEAKMPEDSSNQHPGWAAGPGTRMLEYPPYGVLLEVRPLAAQGLSPGSVSWVHHDPPASFRRHLLGVSVETVGG